MKKPKVGSVFHATANGHPLIVRVDSHEHAGEGLCSQSGRPVLGVTIVTPEGAAITNSGGQTAKQVWGHSSWRACYRDGWLAAFWGVDVRVNLRKRATMPKLTRKRVRISGFACQAD